MDSPVLPPRVGAVPPPAEIFSPLGTLEQDALDGAGKASPTLWGVLLILLTVAFCALFGYLVVEAVGERSALAAAWVAWLGKALLAGTVVGGAAAGNFTLPKA